MTGTPESSNSRARKPGSPPTSTTPSSAQSIGNPQWPIIQSTTLRASACFFSHQPCPSGRVTHRFHCAVVRPWKSGISSASRTRTSNRTGRSSACNTCFNTPRSKAFGYPQSAALLNGCSCGPSGHSTTGEFGSEGSTISKSHSTYRRKGSRLSALATCMNSDTKRREVSVAPSGFAIIRHV